MVNFYIFVSHALCKLQVIICEESFHGISGMSFVISLTRPTLMFNLDAIHRLNAGLLSLSLSFSLSKK